MTEEQFAGPNPFEDTGGEEGEWPADPRYYRINPICLPRNPPTQVEDEAMGGYANYREDRDKRHFFSAFGLSGVIHPTKMHLDSYSMDDYGKMIKVKYVEEHVKATGGVGPVQRGYEKFRTMEVKRAPKNFFLDLHC